jgi:hypothetical protein
MRLWIKVSLIAAATLFAAAGVFMTTWRMDVNGVWPYTPLQRHERTLTLENGGLLHVVEVENRDFGAKDNLLNAWYTERSGTARESAFFGGLTGSADEVRAWAYGDVVVVLQPYSHRGVSVRTTNHGWTSFDMDLPSSDDLRAGNLAFNYSGLTIEELRAMAAPVESLPPRHRGLVTIDDFSPATGELYVTYTVRAGHINRVRLRLETDGSAFRLVAVERLKGDTSRPVPPYLAMSAPQR